jgi:hypothetical protein
MVEDFLEFSGGFAEAVTFPATIVKPSMQSSGDSRRTV